MFKRYIEENCKAQSTHGHSRPSLLSSFPPAYSFSGPMLVFSKTSLGGGRRGGELAASPPRWL